MASAANRQMLRASSTSSSEKSRPSRSSSSSTRAITCSRMRSGMMSSVLCPHRCMRSRSASLSRGSSIDVTITGRRLRMAMALVAKWSIGYSVPSPSPVSNAPSS